MFEKVLCFIVPGGDTFSLRAGSQFGKRARAAIGAKTSRLAGEASLGGSGRRKRSIRKSLHQQSRELDVTHTYLHGYKLERCSTRTPECAGYGHSRSTVVLLRSSTGPRAFAAKPRSEGANRVPHACTKKPLSRQDC